MKAATPVIHDGGSWRVAIGDPSGVAEARRTAAALAKPLGFSETAAGQLALATTEVASNIVKHAQRGALVFRRVEHEGRLGIEVLALDKGPGIANLAESLRDGHSTAGSAGQGLGALLRMTTGFELFSQPGNGTMARFEVWARAAPHVPPSVLEGVVCVAKDGEEVCGDAWASTPWRDRQIVVLADGLGHGPDAAVASRAALAAAAKHAGLKAVEIMEAVHGALRPTRGAAAAVIVLQPAKRLCDFCGVGNIAAAVWHGGKARNMVSHNGILGHTVRTFQEFSYPFPAGALCIAHSDGLTARWDIGAYPGLGMRHPSIVAGVLFRDYSRGRDDATVVAVRNSA